MNSWQLAVLVSYKDKNERLQLLVVEGEGPSLMGRNWLRQLNVELKHETVMNVQRENASSTLEAMLKKFSELFMQR